MRSGIPGSSRRSTDSIALLDGRIGRARALVLVGSEFLVRRLRGVPWR
jgi:hypothetical protein